MATGRQPAAAKGKKSRKPSVKDTAHKPMEKAESAQSERHTCYSRFSLLLDLPRELRIRIYEYAVWTEGECVITKAGSVPEPPLLMTSKTIRREAMDVYYSINAMRFVVSSYDHATERLMFHKLGILKARYGVKANVVGAVFYGPFNWSNLKSSLQTLHQGMGNYARFEDPVADEMSDSKIMIGMMRSTLAMRSVPWEEAESDLELLRVGLIAVDDRWASNRPLEMELQPTVQDKTK